MVVENQLQAEQSKLHVFAYSCSVYISYIHCDELFWELILPTNHVPSKWLGAVTLAASMVVVHIEEAQKLVQLSGVQN